MTQAGNPAGTDGVSPIEPEFNLKTSSGGRGYVAWYFAAVLKRHDFSSYIGEHLAADFACALAQSLTGKLAPLPNGDLDYWIRQHALARNAEIQMRRELAAMAALLQGQGAASAVQLDDGALLGIISQHADLAGRICLTHEAQNGEIKPTDAARIFAAAVLAAAHQLAERKDDLQNSVSMAPVPHAEPPAGGYNAKRIAWELERTALNDGFYGGALRVAKDIPGLGEEDLAILDRYATGTHNAADHVGLQDIALRVYNGSTDKALVAAQVPPAHWAQPALVRAGFEKSPAFKRVDLPAHIHEGLQADVEFIPGIRGDVPRD